MKLKNKNKIFLGPGTSLRPRASKSTTPSSALPKF